MADLFPDLKRPLDYECELCGCNEPEEVTGGWRCARCRYQPPECTCYEVTGGHQVGCAFNSRKLAGWQMTNCADCGRPRSLRVGDCQDTGNCIDYLKSELASALRRVEAAERENAELRTQLDAMPCAHDWIYGGCRRCGRFKEDVERDAAGSVKP